MFPLPDAIVSEEIPRLILEFSHFASSDQVMQLQIGGAAPSCLLVPRVNMDIVGLIDSHCVSFELDQVPAKTLHHVLKYLAHHKGKEPDPIAKPIRSIHMARIVSDQWDA